MPFYSSTSSLQLTQNGVISHIYPLLGNEAALNLDIFNHLPSRDEALTARDKAQRTLTGPVELVQGGQAIIGRLPIFLPEFNQTDRFWGFSVAVIKMTALIDAIDLYNMEKQGYLFSLYRFHPTTNQAQPIARSKKIDSSADAETLTIQLPGTEWYLDIIPKQGWFTTTPILFETLLALFFGLFMTTTYAAILQQRRNSQALEAEVKERTKSLDNHLKRLQLSFRAAKQRSFDLNVETDEVVISNEYSDTFGFDPQALRLTRAAWRERIHPDDLPHVDEAYHECIHSRYPSSVEFRERRPDNQWAWIHATGEVIAWDSNGCATRLIGIHTDITERKQSEQVLRALAETKDRSNREATIFKIIVKELANAYGMKYALISIVDDTTQNTARTLSVWAGEDYLDNFTYDLAGTPCANVLTEDRAFCHYPGNIQNIFPLDTMLVDIEAESYIGFPLLNSEQNVIGLIALIDTHIHQPDDLPSLDLMKSLAVRAANEIERTITESRLTLSSRVFEQAREGIIITDADAKIIDVNPTFCHITGYAKEDVISKTPAILSSGRQSPSFYAQMWHDIKTHGHWQGEVWNRKKDGELYAELLTISSLKDDDDNVINYVGLFSDITGIKQQQQQLELIAHYDILTKLPNRTLFADRFRHAIAHATRNKTKLALGFIDLDNFKPVNDTFGHEVGDTVLVETANRIQNCIRKEDTLSRQGGDEFVLLLEDIDTLDQCKETLDRILHTLNQTYIYNNHEYQISASIGVTLFPDDNADLDNLLRHADHAMYQAKLAGKNQYYFFNTAQNLELLHKQAKLKEIKQAFIDKQFCLYYQPKVNMKTGEVFGVEALIRWQHPTKGLIPPLEFLPIIDGHLLEIQVGQWVIEQAVEQLDSWQAQGLEPEVSINISSYHLLSANFLEHLEGVIASYPNLDCRFLQLEILESSTLSNLQMITQIINKCRSLLGVEVALDDFGTGYSSLTHLRNLPAGTIKIDKSFVQDMLDDPNDYAIVEGVIRLANTFNRDVIAEGVESTNHGLMLLLLGCDYAQGYGISKPLPADKIINWLRNTYKINRHWLRCGKQTYTPQQRELKILRIGIEAWIELFKRNVLSESPILDWPSLYVENSYCRSWPARARQNRLFSTQWLRIFEQKHSEMHNVALRIIEKLRESGQSGSEELLLPLDEQVEIIMQSIKGAW